MATTLQEFVSCSIWPYVILYLVYVILKYVILIVALCFCIYRFKKNKVSDVGGISRKSFIFQLACNLVHLTIGRLPMKLSTTKETDSADDKIGAYFLKQEMEDDHVLVLVVHCIALITVGLVVTTKMFFMNVITHMCSTDPAIHCFPQIMNESDHHLVPNISLQARTNDCSLWTDEPFIDRITFLCFELTYSIEGAIVALGGVLALFKPTMNVIIFIAHNIYKVTKKCKLNTPLFVIQFIIGGIGVLIEAILVIGVLISATHSVDEFFMNSMAEKLAMFLISHGIVILFIFGIIQTSFFMPWDIYVNSDDYADSG